MHPLKEELAEIGRSLKRNSSETIIIASAVLFLCLERYHPIEPDGSVHSSTAPSARWR